MPALICDKRSTTLFEVIVATVIFSLVMAGMVSVFVSGKRHVMHARERMIGGEMGKLFLEPLQLDVSQETWDTGATSNGLTMPAYNYTTYCDSNVAHTRNKACPSVASQRKVNNIDYTAQYVVNPVAGTDLRKVKVQISWTEFTP